jgi:hypothetical protein
LSGYATESWANNKFLTSHQSLSSYAKKSAIPTSNKNLTNDAGYLTSHQSLSSYAKKSAIPTSNKNLTNDAGYLTQHQSLSSYAKKTGTYSSLRAKATTKEDVGLSNVSNYSQTHYDNRYGRTGEDVTFKHIKANKTIKATGNIIAYAN